MKTLVATCAVLAFVVITGIVFAQTRSESSSPASVVAPRDAEASVAKRVDPVLGKVLFEHVTSVHFCGVNMPSNSDGSLGAWVAKGEGVPTEMTIYENFIVKEALLPDGTTYRETHPYDQLGPIEQRIPAKAKRRLREK